MLQRHLCCIIYFEVGIVKKRTRLKDSLKYAWQGLRAGLQNERNMKIHLVFVALVTAAGFLLEISTYEWLACLAFFGLVIGAELINTAIEAVIDLCSPEYNEKAKLAKNAAAGAVLVCSVLAAIAGIVIFLPKLWALLS